MSARLARRTILSALVMTLAACVSSRSTTPEEQTVENARATIAALSADPGYQVLVNLLRNSQGVLIFPEVYRGGFFVGGEGGTGILLVRRADGSWGYPAFHTMAGGSFGFQFGGQISEIVLAIRTERGIDAILSRYATLGADANGALLTVGAGVEARTGLDADADIYAFSRNQGLFAGISIEGSVITPEVARNAAYYGSGATIADILAGRRINMHADPLRQSLP